jgi:hypothetical protein
MKFKSLSVQKDDLEYVFAWDVGNNKQLSLGDFASLKEGIELSLNHAKLKAITSG